MILEFVTTEQLIERARAMKFYNLQMEQILTVKEACEGGGLYAWMNAERDFQSESALIGRMKLIKGVVDQYGDAAIDKYMELTTQPDKAHPFYKDFELLDNFCPELNVKSLLVPMKKEEFEAYLEVYNKVFK